MPNLILSFQSLCRSEGPVLRLGSAAKEMHHSGGKHQNEPVGAKHLKMPCEYHEAIVWGAQTSLLLTRLVFDCFISLFSALKLNKSWQKTQLSLLHLQARSLFRMYSFLTLICTLPHWKLHPALQIFTAHKQSLKPALWNISFPTTKDISGLNNLTLRELHVPSEWSRTLPQSFTSDCWFISTTALPFIFNVHQYWEPY